jgi:hypothetical protein
MSSHKGRVEGHMTVRECADQFQVVPQTIRKWIWTGRLPAQKVQKGRQQWTYLVNAEDWQRFLVARQQVQLPDAQSIPARAMRPSRSAAFMESSDPEDRYVKQRTLMAKALKGCRASREILRGDPYRLMYWMAVDGLQ